MSNLVKRNKDMFKSMFDFMDDFFYDPFESLELDRSSISATREENDILIMEIDMPGFKKEDLSIEVKEDCVYVSAQNKTKSRKSSFARYIPHQFDSSTVEAELEDGVLTVKIKKRSDISAKKIEIKTKAG